MNKYRNQRYRIIKGEKLLRTGRHGDSCQQPPKRKEEDKLWKQGGSGRELRERRRAYKAAVAKSSSKRKSRRRVAWQGGSCSQEKPKRRITKGDKLGRQGVSGLWFGGSATQSLRSKNPYSFQLSGDWRETHEGRSSQEQARMEITKGDKWRKTNEGRQMKAGAAKSRLEWRSCRETNEGRGSQEQARMEITKGDKWRETNEGRSGQEQARMEITKGDKWRQEQPRAGQNGDRAERQMKGDKAAEAAKSRPEWRSCRETNEGRLGGSGSDFGDQQLSLWEVRTPIASSSLGKKFLLKKK